MTVNIFSTKVNIHSQSKVGKVQDEEWHLFFPKHAYHDDRTSLWFYTYNSLRDWMIRKLMTGHSDTIIKQN